MRVPRRLEYGQRAELTDHLGELRGRLVICLLAFAATTTFAFVFRGDLLAWLNAPLPDGLRKPVTLSPAEPFTTSLKISMLAGFALALPVILWQVWSFLAPTVEKGSQRIIAVFVALAGALLAAGITFGYFMVLPPAVGFLTTFDANHYDIEVRASNYYSFVLFVLSSVGVVFELPIFLLALTRLRVLSSAKLRRNRRLGYVAMAVVAVVLPGVDPMTTALLMGPLFILFEASIWLAVFFERRWKIVPSAEPGGQPA